MFEKRLPPLLRMFNIPSIAASGNQLYSFHNDLKYWRDWAPFPHFYIQNLSTVNLAVIFNYDQNTQLIVSAGGYQTRKNQPYCNFNIINQSSTTASGNNNVTVWIENIP